MGKPAAERLNQSGF